MNKFGGEFWDERFGSEEFIYGTEPNSFFKEILDGLPAGRILMLGEGEGRNAVYAAKKGWHVDAVDFSNAAREKALLLSKENSVKINYEVADLSTYELKINYYDAVGMIYLHIHPDLRKTVHPKVIDALKPGGMVIMEVFDKEQLGRDSGGPQNYDMLYSKEELKKDFERLNIELLEKKTLTLEEGRHHEGEAVVVRLIARKP